MRLNMLYVVIYLKESTTCVELVYTEIGPPSEEFATSPNGIVTPLLVVDIYS